MYAFIFIAQTQLKLTPIAKKMTQFGECIVCATFADKGKLSIAVIVQTNL